MILDSRAARVLGAASVFSAMTAFAAPAASAAPNPATPAPGSVAAQLADSVPGIPGLPTGVPPAATAPPPVLPEPPASQWPFPSDFSQTEGTGLVQGGASLWTDFVYDDHGAEDPANQNGSSDLAPVHGGYTYPTGPGYDANNADIFTAAVGYDGSATYWRVDWNSMPDPSIPIAEWTMTPSGDTASLTPTWPANAGVSTSTGIEYALVVDSTEGELIDAATGAEMATFPTQVDDAARSFVVRIPTSVLAVSGDWSIQLASGLSQAGAATPTFATVPPSDGGLPEGGANVYNVTFRTYQQEAELVCPDSPLDPGVVAELQSELDDYSTTDGVPTVECGNFWMENDQANTLSGVDPNVAKYALDVDWSQLAAKATVAAPDVYGYSDRWYETPLDLSSYGAGVIPAAGTAYTGPTYLSRIQPYAVYVPSGYSFSDPRPTPLTWILHSLGENLNQYGALDPSQLAEVCQDRDSICATTEGFSDGQWYYAEAEVDFWDVWHQLALSYDLDPDATTISGYSMGGWASYKLPEEYPDVFAEAEPLEGPVICGLRVYGSVEGYAGGTQCTSDGDSTPLLVNLRWIPYVMTCGGIDELVPVTGCDTQAQDIESLGYRVDEFLYPTEDHLVYATQNDFGPPDAALAHPPADRELDPGSFTFVWYPNLDSGPSGIDGAGAAGEIGPSRDYWVSGLSARQSAPGDTATLVADDAAIPDPAVTASASITPGPSASPTPYVESSESWALGAIPRPAQTLSLTLTNVAGATVDATAAGLTCAAVTVDTDGPTDLGFTHLEPGHPLTSNGATVATASPSGTASVALATGATTLDVCSAAATLPPSVPEAPLAAGLAGAGLGTAGLLIWRRRRRLAGPA